MRQLGESLAARRARNSALIRCECRLFAVTMALGRWLAVACNLLRYVLLCTLWNDCLKPESEVIAKVSYKMPLSWEHAGLDEMKAFLKARVAEGVYRPAFNEGLD